MRAFQVLPLLLLSLAVSCSSAQTPHDPTKPEPAKTTVRVRNQKPIDFNVYVGNGTHRVRLGIVPAMTDRIFTIPSHLIIDKGMLRFQADPIGSQNVLSSDEGFVVHEGDEVSLTIS